MYFFKVKAHGELSVIIIFSPFCIVFLNESDIRFTIALKAIWNPLDA